MAGRQFAVLITNKEKERETLEEVSKRLHIPKATVARLSLKIGLRHLAKARPYDEADTTDAD